MNIDNHLLLVGKRNNFPTLVLSSYPPKSVFRDEIVFYTYSCPTYIIMEEARLDQPWRFPTGLLSTSYPKTVVGGRCGGAQL